MIKNSDISWLHSISSAEGACACDWLLHLTLRGASARVQFPHVFGCVDGPSLPCYWEVRQIWKEWKDIDIFTLSDIIYSSDNFLWIFLFRLKDSWALVDGAMVEKMGEFNVLFSHSKNFAAYRQAVAACKRPCAGSWLPNILVYIRWIITLSYWDFKKRIFSKVSFMFSLSWSRPSWRYLPPWQHPLICGKTQAIRQFLQSNFQHILSHECINCFLTVEECVRMC